MAGYACSFMMAMCEWYCCRISNRRLAEALESDCTEVPTSLRKTHACLKSPCSRRSSRLILSSSVLAESGAVSSVDDGVAVVPVVVAAVVEPGDGDGGGGSWSAIVEQRARWSEREATKQLTYGVGESAERDRYRLYCNDIIRAGG